MKISFGHVYAQNFTKSENWDVKAKIRDLMEFGQSRNEDYFITEYDYNLYRHDRDAYPRKAYRVEAYNKENNKIGQKIYPRDKFIDEPSLKILNFNKKA